MALPSRLPLPLDELCRNCIRALRVSKTPKRDAYRFAERIFGCCDQEAVFGRFRAQSPPLMELLAVPIFTVEWFRFMVDNAFAPAVQCHMIATEALSPIVVNCEPVDGVTPLDILFSFLKSNTERKCDDSTLGFTKIVSYLFTERNVESILHVNSHPSILHFLSSHLEFRPYCDVLRDLLRGESVEGEADARDVLINDKNWDNVSANLLKYLSRIGDRCKGDDSDRVNSVVNSLDILFALFDQCSKQRRTDVERRLRQLEKPPLINALVVHVLSKPPTQDRWTYEAVVEVLARFVELDDQAARRRSHHSGDGGVAYTMLTKQTLAIHYDYMANGKKNTIPMTVQTRLMGSLGEITSLLTSSPDEASVVGGPGPRLGIRKLSLVRLVCALASAHSLPVQQCLLKHQTLARCVELVFRYRNHTILHCLVVKTIVQVMADDAFRITSRSLVEELRIHETLMSHLTRIGTATLFSSDPSLYPQYMGHLLEVANAVATCPCVSDLLRKDAAWTAFTTSTLSQLNHSWRPYDVDRSQILEMGLMNPISEQVPGATPTPSRRGSAGIDVTAYVEDKFPAPKKKKKRRRLRIKTEITPEVWDMFDDVW